MSAQPGDQHWFISLNGKRYGPYSFAALAEAAAKGVIKGDTSVWRLGWVKWHPARRVPGLIEEVVQPEPLDQASDREGDDRAPDPTDRPPWQDEEAGDAAATPQPRRFEDEQVTADAQWQRRAQVENDVAEAPRRTSPPTEDNAPTETLRRRKSQLTEEDAPTEAPRRKTSRSAEEDAPIEAPRRARRSPADEDIAGDAPPIEERPANDARRPTEDAPIPAVPPQVRDRRPTAPSPRRGRDFSRSAGIAALTVMLFAGAGWSLFYSGMIVMVDPRRPVPPAESVPAVAPEPPPSPSSARGLPSNLAADSGLPDSVAALPAVIALQRHDPAAFARFSKRFGIAVANAPETAFPSLTRAALRKSLKRQLANAPADTLLEITEVYLAYMQALQSLSPESCVALSDDSKGANLTVNLAQQLPVLFGRELAILERVASVDPGTVVAAPTADQAQQYINAVYAQLRKLPVQSELLNSNTLTESQFQPYCALVIAFYQTALGLSPDDRINLLRFLYAAAIDPDDDVQK